MGQSKREWEKERGYTVDIKKQGLSYLFRFPDGKEVRMKAHQLAPNFLKCIGRGYTFVYFGKYLNIDSVIDVKKKNTLLIIVNLKVAFDSLPY